MPAATILIPTHDHGRLLTRSVRSALDQSVSDIDVVIVGDGITETGRVAALELVRLDRRVRFVDGPKGVRHGESRRHEILSEVVNGIVCYLSDDDLLFPNHVAQMRKLLDQADFANTLPVYVEPGGSIGVWAVDLALDTYRGLLMLGHNRIPLSAAAHTLDAYQRLEHGWRTTPIGVPTDLFMWQQFLATPGMRFASGSVPTMVNFPSPARRSWAVEERLDEIDTWRRNISNPAWRSEFEMEVSAIRRHADFSGDADLAPLGRLNQVDVGNRILKPFSRSVTIGELATLGAYERDTGLVEVLEPEATRFQFGPDGVTWLPVCGDWDGDGRATIGLYDSEHAVFHLRNQMSPGRADFTVSYGPQAQRWIPLAGDWRGTGRDSIGLYDPVNSVFHLRDGLEEMARSTTFGFGAGSMGLIPLAGDWNGDGADGVGLYDPSTAVFMLNDRLDAGEADEVFQFGPLGQRWAPIAGDWHRTGRDDVGLFAPRIGVFYLRSGEQSRT